MSCTNTALGSSPNSAAVIIWISGAVVVPSVSARVTPKMTFCCWGDSDGVRGSQRIISVSIVGGGGAGVALV